MNWYRIKEYYEPTLRWLLWPKMIKVEPGQSVDYEVPKNYSHKEELYFYPKYNCAGHFGSVCQFGSGINDDITK